MTFLTTFISIIKLYNQIWQNYFIYLLFYLTYILPIFSKPSRKTFFPGIRHHLRKLWTKIQLDSSQLAIKPKFSKNALDYSRTWIICIWFPQGGPNAHPARGGGLHLRLHHAPPPPAAPAPPHGTHPVSTFFCYNVPCFNVNQIIQEFLISSSLLSY